MTDQTGWRLLARYLSGECSEEEIEKLHEWASSDPNNQELLEQTIKIWNALDLESQNWHIAAARLRLAHEAGLPARIKELKPKGESRALPGARNWSDRRNKFVGHFFRMAAMVLIGVSLAYLYKIAVLRSPQQETVEWKQLLVANGKKATITLEDGTKITLDAGSVFKYPQKFTEKKREVFLQGEGYFEVSSLKDRAPFVVHTNEAVVNVLGTEFNVRAWPQTDRVKVAVAEGKVSFHAKEGSKEAVIILPGQLSILKKNAVPSSPRQVDLNRQLAWLKYEMVFEDAPLSEVLDQLERWYNLKFRFTDDSLQSLLLTTHIKNEPIAEILESISLVMNLKYERSGNTVVFSPKDLN